MIHIPDSNWLRRRIEDLVLEIELAAPSGLLSQDIILEANVIRAYLAEFDRLRVQFASSPPAPHGHQEQET